MKTPLVGTVLLALLLAWPGFPQATNAGGVLLVPAAPVKVPAP